MAALYFISCGRSSGHSETEKDGISKLLNSGHKKTYSFPENDTANVMATIDYRMRGCFGGDTCTIILVGLKGKTVAVLKSPAGRSVTELDSNTMQLYEQFIHELKTSAFGFGCTNQSVYSVQTRLEKIERTDDGCSWDGFYMFRNALFPPDKLVKLSSVSP